MGSIGCTECADPGRARLGFERVYVGMEYRGWGSVARRLAEFDQ